MQPHKILGTTVKSVIRILPAIVGVVVLIVVLAWMSGTFHQKIPPGTKPYEQRRVSGQETVAVEVFRGVERVDAVGTVEPRRKTDVASRLLATINEITVEPGDRISKGQLLATLDDREVQAQLGEAEAAAAGIDADLAVRARDYQRYQQMFREKAVTKEAFDQIEGAFRVAQAQLRRTQQQINRIRVMLTYSQIKAQTAGVVADRYVDPGDLAVPGKPLLTIHNPDELELHANVREGLTGDIRVGMKLPVRVDALARNMTGTVREIVPRAEAASRSVLVKVTLPSDQTKGLYIGMFGRLSIPVGKIDRVVVSADAVQRVGQLDLVDVVEQDGTIERRFVRTGLRLGDKIEILSGLIPGQTVVRSSST